MMNENELVPLRSSDETKTSPHARCTTMFRWITGLTTGGAIVVLAIFQVLLFLQLQTVTFQIHQVENQLHDQAKQTQIVKGKVEKEHILTVIQMAGTFVLLTCLVTTFHMTAHLRNWNEPDVQRKIVAILWMPPIYAVTSFVSIVVPSTHEYMMILKDFYEAYCIYQFLSFLIAVLGRGSRGAVVEVLARNADHLDKPFRCLQCLFHPPPSESDQAMASAVLLECQLLAMQFVFIKPFTAIITFSLHIMNETYKKGNNEISEAPWVAYLMSVEFWVLMVQNLSVFFAFTGLLKFYHAVQGYLMWCQPLNKFLCIKGVVFMTFWQGLIIALVTNFRPASNWNEDGDYAEKDRSKAMAVMLQNILICLEMLFFSLTHFCVFPTDEWQEGYIPKSLPAPGIAIYDFVQDVSEVFDHSRQGVNARKRTQKTGD